LEQRPLGVPKGKTPSKGAIQLKGEHLKPGPREKTEIKKQRWAGKKTMHPSFTRPVPPGGRGKEQKRKKKQKTIQEDAPRSDHDGSFTKQTSKDY